MPAGFAATAMLKVRREEALTGEVLKLNLHEENGRFIWKREDGSAIKDPRGVDVVAATKGAAIQAAQRAFGWDFYGVKT